MAGKLRSLSDLKENRGLALEMTAVQFYVLSSLWEIDGVKFKELAQKLSMDGATLTGTLDRLERQGVFTRADDLEDRRSIDACFSGR